jgi:hypothetical protein
MPLTTAPDLNLDPSQTVLAPADTPTASIKPFPLPPIPLNLFFSLQAGLPGWPDTPAYQQPTPTPTYLTHRLLLLRNNNHGDNTLSLQLDTSSPKGDKTLSLHSPQQETNP